MTGDPGSRASLTPDEEASLRGVVAGDQPGTITLPLSAVRALLAEVDGLRAALALMTEQQAAAVGLIAGARKAALEEAAAMMDARAAEGCRNGSWDDGLDAVDAAMILAAEVRAMVARAAYDAACAAREDPR